MYGSPTFFSIRENPIKMLQNYSSNLIFTTDFDIDIINIILFLELLNIFSISGQPMCNSYE